MQFKLIKMNFKLLTTLFLIFVSVNCSYASFPVERHLRTTNNTEVSSVSYDDEVLSPKIGTQKSQGIALILALTLGLLAAHRWYLKRHPFTNIFFIFTLGGVGIWLLCDIIGIITKKFGPGTGRYKKTFF